MAEIKSHEFETALARSRGRHRIFAFYGPDQGLISERAAAAASMTGIDLADPFSVVRLEANDLQSDPGRLADEIGSMGLFGGEKLVWIKSTGADKRIADTLSQLPESQFSGAYLVVEAGDLKKGAALRKLGETASHILLVPCYADDQRTLNALIDAELSEAGLGITPAGRALLADCLGGDRIASRNELRKLALYCLGRKTVDRDDVLAIVGDASATSVDDAVDAVLAGNAEALLHEMKKIATSKTPIFLVLQACMRQFQQLELWSSEMQSRKVQAGQILQTMGRGVHFRRKPVIEAALRNWPLAALSREAQRFQSTIFQTRQRPQIEESVAFQSLLAATLHAARFNRR